MGRVNASSSAAVFSQASASQLELSCPFRTLGFGSCTSNNYPTCSVRLRGFRAGRVSKFAYVGSCWRGGRLRGAVEFPVPTWTGRATSPTWVVVRVCLRGHSTLWSLSGPEVWHAYVDARGRRLRGPPDRPQRWVTRSARTGQLAPKWASRAEQRL